MVYCFVFVVFFFKQKTAYEMRISDWSSDVCSSDLRPATLAQDAAAACLLHDAVDDEEVPGEVLHLDHRELALDAVAVLRLQVGILPRHQIGSASCRGRVCQCV